MRHNGFNSLFVIADLVALHWGFLTLDSDLLSDSVQLAQTV